MTTPIAELIQNHQVFFETMWVALGITSFVFFLLAGTISRVDRKLWYEGYIISFWCLGASISVLLASV